MYTLNDLAALAAVVTVAAWIVASLELDRRRARRDRATARAEGTGPYAPTAALPKVDLETALIDHARLKLPNLVGVPVTIDIGHPAGLAALTDDDGNTELVPLRELA